MTEIQKSNGLRYVIRYPEGFTRGDAHPILFFLHGAGTRGESIDEVLDHNFLRAVNAHGDLPFVIVVPHCTEDTWYDAWERLKELVAHVSSLDFADPSRIYVMGASMGGYATWQLAMSLPEAFAAIVPICGGGMTWNAKRLKTTPVWAFHGALDPVVPLSESQRMVDAVNAKGGSAKLTVYPENGHDAWSDTFANRAVFDWLLSHQKQGTPPVGSSELHGSATYG